MASPFGPCLIPFYKPELSSLEIAFDFYGDSLYKLFFLLVSSIFLKFNRKGCRYYYGAETMTFYASDLSRSLKGLKIYPKSEGGECFLRLELTLKRNILKKHGLNFFLIC